MKQKLSNVWIRLKSFNRDESGEQNMSTVMLLGLGALVVVGLIAIGVYIFNYASEAIEEGTDDPGFQGPS